MVAACCWFAGMICFGTVWSLEYPNLDLVPTSERGVVATRLLLDALLGLIACLLLPRVLSRRRPSRANGTLALGLLAASGFSSWSAPAALLVLVVVASWLEWRWLIAAASVTIVSSVVVEMLFSSRYPLTLLEATLGMVVMLGVPLVVGRAVGNRRRLMEAYRERAEAAERERDQAVARIRAEERSAVARDMHDGLSHRLSLISLHAGALSFREDLTPIQLRDTAATIQSTALEAAEELRQVLMVLRTDDDREQPHGMDQLHRLVEDARARGSRVSIRIDEGLPLDDLTPMASVALARAVAEGLANAVKHAPESPIDVTVTGVDDGVLVSVTNPLPAQPHTSLPGGYGLVGLRERLETAHGWLDATATADRFRLRAWAPW
ncbi:signal transduction histidine kinase [Propioniferax innocua]|uniref:histidine kinase n=2 Tax=Propioniferax innocua TaxID=1753 RepID=A0A542ZR60_9ACTN|nr:signal transduction histidine kinase [Propioniferax innocua]